MPATQYLHFVRMYSRDAATNMLTGMMINRGAAIFLTTHVLEIVERLCSHMAIIAKGRPVAILSLHKLSAGVAGALPEQGQRFTLEEILLALGADCHRNSTQELSWLA